MSAMSKKVLVVCGLAMAFSGYAMASYTGTSATSQQSAAMSTAETVINVNTADVKQLTAVKGIGLKLAQSIIEYRKEHGPFAALEDLSKVKGISQQFVEQHKADLRI